MKRVAVAMFLCALPLAQAFGSAGFSCETAENETPKLQVEGATPRSGSALINFGGSLEIGGRKIEFKKTDAKSFAWRAGGLRLRVTPRVGQQTYTIIVDAMRNPKDEDDWSGTYEMTATAASANGDKKEGVTKKSPIRGKVKCFVD